MTIDQEDLDFEVSSPVDERPEVKLSTELTRTKQDDVNLDTMMSRVSMEEEVDVHSVDIGAVPIFENSRHIDVQLPLDNDYPLWAGDTSARRSPEG